MTRIFRDRTEAGRELAQALEHLRGEDVVVLGVPRGGVAVAAEVARALEAPLDVLMAHKIGAPFQPELAIGAVVSGVPEPLLDPEAVEALYIPESYIQQEVQRQQEELERRVRLFRGELPPRDLEGKTVVLIDDGIATGYTIRAALEGLRRSGARRLVVAVPVAPEETVESLREMADEVFALQTPTPFYAVGVWYEDFGQVEDEEVSALLRSLSGF
jgi:putative phosphoribosyl transferase